MPLEQRSSRVDDFPIKLFNPLGHSHRSLFQRLQFGIIEKTSNEKIERLQLLFGEIVFAMRTSALVMQSPSNVVMPTSGFSRSTRS